MTQRLRPPVPWLLAAAVVLLLGFLWVALTGMRPAFDAYGWLVWGRQALHLNLNMESAPSWKPLTFLFALPYVLIAGHAAVWLWMVTAVAGAFAGSLFAGAIAYRLTGESRPAYARWIAAVFAGVGILGIEGYWHFILIAYSDPMIATLCLAAIYAHLSGRLRLAWLLAVLVALGRPEGWLVVGAYAAWTWWSKPEMRRLVVIGCVAIPLLWFGIPTLTNHKPFISGDIESISTHPLAGNKFTGTLDGFLHLYELPMQLGAVGAIVLAVIWREREWLTLIGAAALWVLAEILFALHGWAPSPRYMFEPAAVMVVLTGAAVGRVLALPGRPLVLVRWAAVALVIALVATLVPHARIRARLAHNGILLGQTWARQIRRLHTVVDEAGGARAILDCGQAVTTIPWQSILAWELDNENVINVGWKPERWIRYGQPIVVFTPYHAGWQVRPIHMPPDRRARCARLHIDSAFG